MFRNHRLVVGVMTAALATPAFAYAADHPFMYAANEARGSGNNRVSDVRHHLTSNSVVSDHPKVCATQFNGDNRNDEVGSAQCTETQGSVVKTHSGSLLYPAVHNHDTVTALLTGYGFY